MLRGLTVIALLFTVACAQDMDPRSIKNQDAAFSKYVHMFESMYGRSTSSISMGFAKQEGRVIGMCKRWSNGYRQIEIDPEYWNDTHTSEQAKIGLIFHELGHCALNRDHNSEVEYYSGEHIRGDVPVSLMYPYNFYSSSYEELQDYYFNELFHPVNANPVASNKLAAKQSSDDDCVVDLE